MVLYIDDIAISEAINEIEEELLHERRSLFDTEHIMDVDLNDIDANLKQISPTEDDFIIHSARDAASAEGSWIKFFLYISEFTIFCWNINNNTLSYYSDDLAIADAINEIESELKKEKTSLFNPTTVVMLLIAGGIVTSKLANMFFQ